MNFMTIFSYSLVYILL